MERYIINISEKTKNLILKLLFIGFLVLVVYHWNGIYKEYRDNEDVFIWSYENNIYSNITTKDLGFNNNVINNFSIMDSDPLNDPRNSCRCYEFIQILDRWKEQRLYPIVAYLVLLVIIRFMFYFDINFLDKYKDKGEK